MSSYRLSPEAIKDLLLIREYTQTKWSNLQAQNYITTIENKCNELAKTPGLGRERPEIKPGYRSLIAGKHILFYRLRNDEIEVLRIVHTRMDIKNRI